MLTHTDNMLAKIEEVKSTIKFQMNKILVENLYAGILRINSLSENNMKSISTVTPAITENTDGMIVKMHTPVIDIKVSVSP